MVNRVTKMDKEKKNTNDGKRFLEKDKNSALKGDGTGEYIETKKNYQKNGRKIKNIETQKQL